jgi:tetratricopeptide (TPR) repeat protein
MLKPRKELIARFKEARREIETAEARAALQYLIAETQYWGTLAEIRKKMDVNIIKGAPERVIPAFLRALELLPKTGKNKDVQALRRDVVARLRQLASTEAFGASLDPRLKEKMVTEFIDQVKGTPEGPKSWAPGTIAKVYKNLDIKERLTAHFQIPTEPPEDRGKLSEAIKAAWLSGRREKALRFARTYEKRYELDLPLSAMDYRILEIYRKTDSSRGLSFAKKMAEVDHLAYLEVYFVSRSVEPELSDAERFKYIEAYLDGGSKEKSSSADIHQRAAQRLMIKKDYATGLKVIEEFLGGFEGTPARKVAHLWYSKGVCCARLGKTDDARSSYRRCIKIISDLEDADQLRRMCRRAMSRLEQ